MKQQREKGATGQIKKLTSNLDGFRKNVDGGNEVSQNISDAKATYNEFENVIKNQTSTISNLKAFQKNLNSEGTRNLEAKRFFSSLAQRIKNEIKIYIDLAQVHFMNANHKVNKEEEFKKIRSQITKMINSLRQESDTPEKIYSALNKILSFKEQLISQFLRVLLYKKNVLWRDLNIIYDDYIHGQVKNILNLLKTSEQKYGFIPASLQFKIPKLELQQGTSSLPDLMKIVLNDFNEMTESVKNYSKLNDEPQLIQDISKNQHIVKGLRQKVEALTNNYNALLEKYRGLQISKGKVSANQEKSLSDKIQELESSLLKKEQDIIELKQINMKTDSLFHNLKQKNKELEDQISKWQNFQLPKIKELQMNQKTLYDEFTKVKKDFETYSSLYQVEREEKIKAYSQLKQQMGKFNDLVNILGRQRRKIKDLKGQIKRQDQIIMELVQKAPDP